MGFTLQNVLNTGKREPLPVVGPEQIIPSITEPQAALQTTLSASASAIESSSEESSEQMCE